MHVLIDYMVNASTGYGAIDAGRVGAFGFSSGGFTVLAAAGGEPDLTRVIEHCRAHPQFYDCRLIGQHPPSADAIQRSSSHSNTTCRPSGDGLGQAISRIGTAPSGTASAITTAANQATAATAAPRRARPDITRSRPPSP